jgi:hypothetical protein
MVTIFYKPSCIKIDRMADQVRTGVDSLIALLDKFKKVSLEEASQKLQLPLHIVQEWVDFLVEEQVVGLEYKFITPYIYLLKPEEVHDSDIDEKETFFAKAKAKNISADQTLALWRDYVKTNRERIKQTFYQKAREKNLSPTQIDGLFAKYEELLLK